MTNKCNACGAGPGSAKISIGGTILCRDCAPTVQEEMERLREAGKPVDVRRIAHKMQNRGMSLTIRDMPTDLWIRLGHRAVDDRTSKRGVILAALEQYLS